MKAEVAITLEASVEIIRARKREVIVKVEGSDRHEVLREGDTLTLKLDYKDPTLD